MSCPARSRLHPPRLPRRIRPPHQPRRPARHPAPSPLRRNRIAAGRRPARAAGPCRHDGNILRRSRTDYHRRGDSAQPIASLPVAPAGSLTSFGATTAALAPSIGSAPAAVEATTFAPGRRDLVAGKLVRVERLRGTVSRIARGTAATRSNDPRREPVRTDGSHDRTGDPHCPAGRSNHPGNRTGPACRSRLARPRHPARQPRPNAFEFHAPASFSVELPTLDLLEPRVRRHRNDHRGTPRANRAGDRTAAAGIQRCR